LVVPTDLTSFSYLTCNNNIQRLTVIFYEISWRSYRPDEETSRKSLREFYKEPDVDNMPEFER
jgi:hypothetical protein